MNENPECSKQSAINGAPDGAEPHAIQAQANHSRPRFVHSKEPALKIVLHDLASPRLKTALSGDHFQVVIC